MYNIYNTPQLKADQEFWVWREEKCIGYKVRTLVKYAESECKVNHAGKQMQYKAKLKNLKAWRSKMVEQLQCIMEHKGNSNYAGRIEEDRSTESLVHVVLEYA